VLIRDLCEEGRMGVGVGGGTENKSAAEEHSFYLQRETRREAV